MGVGEGMSHPFSKLGLTINLSLPQTSISKLQYFSLFGFAVDQAQELLFGDDIIESDDTD